MKASLANVACTPWDGFHAYLFDIDGTLIHCTDAVHYFAFCDALQTLSRQPLTLEGVTAHGNTDVGILREALELAGVAEEDWRPRLPDILKSMGSFVETRLGELCVNVLPCVREVLEHLKAQGAVLGIATGNLESIGKAKLGRAGLLHYFKVAGWSDQFEYRADVFRATAETMQTVIGPDASICVVGDTPADILAARLNHLPAIAVATGVYSREQLAKHAPYLCLGSLAELLVDQCGPVWTSDGAADI